MISGVHEEPAGAPEVRDATGFAVGSPEWLEAQRRLERGETPSGLRRQGMWQIFLGSVIIAISVFTTITIVTGENSLGIRLRPVGYLAICVAPLLIGGYSIIAGLRLRSQHQRSGSVANPPGQP